MIIAATFLLVVAIIMFCLCFRRMGMNLVNKDYYDGIYTNSRKYFDGMYETSMSYYKDVYEDTQKYYEGKFTLLDELVTDLNKSVENQIQILMDMSLSLAARIEELESKNEN